MSDWGVPELKEALPASQPEEAGEIAADEAASTGQTPQAAGWVQPTAFDYGITEGDWASNAAVYEWEEEFGDVGPAFPELEAVLFGSETRMTQGVDFQSIAEIKVVQEGAIRINPVVSFKDAGLHPVMLRNVELAQYHVPTPIQAYCLPAVLKGHDVIACAQTGSGKTAAYLIPTLSKLMGKAKKLAAPRPNPTTMLPGQYIRAEPLLLVIVPNRELAIQIFDEARKFCYRSMLRPCVIYGGGPRASQAEQLRKGCDVLIGTPGRLVDFINSPHILSFHRLKYVIIDEADELLDVDWEGEMKTIMTGGNQDEGNIQYLMFSATFPPGARAIAREHLAHDHVRIRVGRAGSSHTNIIQRVVFVEPSQKEKALIDLLLATPPCRTIIFVNSKRSADEVDANLYNLEFPSTSIHAGRTQREREDALRAFRTGKCPILVASGVFARGLDIKNVLHVINYDLPSAQYGGIQEYVHRIGRTGRIGNKGLSTSFYNSRDEELAEVLTKILLETKQEVPDFLQSFIPEGYNEENTKLDFDPDTDDEAEVEAEGGADEGGAAGGAWGGDGGEAVDDAPVTGGWGAGAATKAPASDGWGSAPVVAPVVAPVNSASGWGSGTGGDAW